MKTIHLDELTRQAAIDYANHESELKGFERNGPEWKKAFKNYLGFAVGTMSVGRNPRRRNPREITTWPEIFGADGFAGKVNKGFKGPADKAPSLSDVQERIRSSVSTLTYLYLNGVMNIKTSASSHKQGRLDPNEMSDLQFRGSSGEMSKDEADAQNLDVAYHQLAMTIVETACLEFLLPFFTMPSSDVQAVLDSIRIEGKVTAKGIAEARTHTEKKIRAIIGDALKKTSFKKLVLG